MEEKQLEILSHQKHFNLILALGTIFIVFIYALKEFLSFSGFPKIVFGLIIATMIMALFLLMVFLIKQRYHQKIWGLLKWINKYWWLVISIVGIIILYSIIYFTKGSIDLSGWR